MEENRAFRKGDKFKVVGDREMPVESTVIYTVRKEETDSGYVYVQITEQPNIPGRSRFFEGAYHVHASTLRKWELVEEGPVKRPNNRVIKINAVDIRIGETVRIDGETYHVMRKEGTRGNWLIVEEGGRRISVDGSAEVEVLGKRGRKTPPVVHFNPYIDAGKVIIQKNWRPGFGSGPCGVVSLIDVFASSEDLVTCTQKCGEEAREHHWRKG